MEILDYGEGFGEGRRERVYGHGRIMSAVS